MTPLSNFPYWDGRSLPTNLFHHNWKNIPPEDYIQFFFWKGGGGGGGVEEIIGRY